MFKKKLQTKKPFINHYDQDKIKDLKRKFNNPFKFEQKTRKKMYNQCQFCLKIMKQHFHGIVHG